MRPKCWIRRLTKAPGHAIEMHRAGWSLWSAIGTAASWIRGWS